LKNLIEVLTFNHSKRQLDAPFVEADTVGNEEFGVQILFSHGLFAPVGLIRHGILPVHLYKNLFNLIGAVTRRIHSADNCTHAGAGNVINGDRQLLQHFKHAHMGAATGTATTQCQANFRTIPVLTCSLILAGIRGKALCRYKQQDEKGSSWKLHFKLRIDGQVVDYNEPSYT